MGPHPSSETLTWVRFAKYIFLCAATVSVDRKDSAWPSRDYNFAGERRAG